jgi:mannose-6-phosphate isomerase-like protein (cupin superfamily)
VTGHNHWGKAVFTSDERVQPVTTAGNELFQLWQGDAVPSFPDDGAPPPLTGYFPPFGGFRFVIVTVLPETSSVCATKAGRRAERARLELALPGLLDYHEAGGTGMHTTPTLDFEVVLDGELTLELDDGMSVLLRPGDTVVQNGTRHRWLNFGTEPARFAVFMIGAEHAIVEHRQTPKSQR